MNTIGIDLGGTQIRAAKVNATEILTIRSGRITASGTVRQVLDELTGLLESVVDDSVGAIGIGVPSVVDVEKGIVYDVQNIPSWKEVPLKSILEERFGLPVEVNNDANCFALGEFYYGKGKRSHSFIGLTLGTGLGAGIIVHDRLYEGTNCGAGEFGMVSYLDQYYEYYASGQFFPNCHHTAGEVVYRKAVSGDAEALRIMETFGRHLGNAVKMILYTYAPQLIILGGSIRDAYRFFEKTMWEEIRTFAYPKSLESFRLEVSELEHAGVLGAAALYYDKHPE
jgi:glucokinase